MGHLVSLDTLDARPQPCEVVATEPELEATELEHVEIAAGVVRIALDAPAVSSGGHRPEDVDHGGASRSA